MESGPWHGWRDERAEWRRGEWRPWHGPRLFLAVLIGAIQLIGTTVAAGGQSDATQLDPFGYALLVAGPAALVLRRRSPVLVLGITVAATVMYALLGFPRGPYFLAALVALFVAVRRSTRATVWLLCAAAYAAYVGLGWLVPSVGGLELARPTVAQSVAMAAWVVVAVALAEAARVRTQHFAEIARTRAEAARARSEQSRRQASEERLRIARELHDVLGHHLSLINVRAGVALHLLESQPVQGHDEALAALGAIKSASAEALREVRGVLATLHPLDESAPRSPAPGVADLDRLVGEARAAGLSVTVSRVGDPRPLPAELDRAAFRIIQEALTNVRRHAGPAAAAAVALEYRPQSLTLSVSDTGNGPPSSTLDDNGNGIPGMRARAEALGGVLTTGPRAGGGFSVEATLPVRSGPPRSEESP